MATKLKDVVKDVVKQRPAPKSTFGTDPNDPWSVKSYVDESITSDRKSVLARYLKAKGFNPEFISKDQKDAHTKTGEFLKWKRDHSIYEEEETVQEDIPIGNTQSEIRSLVKDSPILKRTHELNREYKHVGVVKSPSTLLRKEDLVNELKDTTIASYKAAAEKDVKELKPMVKGEYGGIAKRMVSRREKGLDRVKMREDNYADPKCATQSTIAATNNTDEVLPKRNISKSARMVKEIYSKHREVKESLYDWEKEDKGGKPLGKKPIEQKADSKDDVGDNNKPNSRMTLKGGTTLTGQTRDTLEIDPMLNNRNHMPDYKSIDDKKLKKQ